MSVPTGAPATTRAIGADNNHPTTKLTTHSGVANAMLWPSYANVHRGSQRTKRDAIQSMV